MKLPVPFIQLPLLFDAACLAAEIDALGESVWRPHPQGFAGNSMLPLVAVNGDAADEAFAGPMAPTAELARCPYLQQVFEAIGATIGRSRLMRLSGQAEVTRHVDQGYYWAERVRVHVPIRTQPTVRFECGDQAINMREGECWIFDTWRQHRVINDADRERIHLVIDTVGGARFWDMVAAGRAAPSPDAAWTRLVEQRADVDAAFDCERVNVPVVMSPWEMSTHFSTLFADARPHPALPQLQARVSQLLRAWQALWFAHGDRAGARPVYTAVMDAFVDDARRIADGIALQNGLPWMSAMRTMVARYAAGAYEHESGRLATMS